MTAEEKNTLDALDIENMDYHGNIITVGVSCLRRALAEHGRLMRAYFGADLPPLPAATDMELIRVSLTMHIDSVAKEIRDIERCLANREEYRLIKESAGQG